jgi:hypothetical protein
VREREGLRMPNETTLTAPSAEPYGSRRYALYLPIAGQCCLSASQGYWSLTFFGGRGPVQAGSASHSAHRMRRSSSPTLTKTNGASSCPVFDPANVAGSPFAFLMVAVFAIVSPVRHARRFFSRRSIKARLPLYNDRCCDQQAK